MNDRHRFRHAYWIKIFLTCLLLALSCSLGCQKNEDRKAAYARKSVTEWTKYVANDKSFNCLVPKGLSINEKIVQDRYEVTVGPSSRPDYLFGYVMAKNYASSDQITRRKIRLGISGPFTEYPQTDNEPDPATYTENIDLSDGCDILQKTYIFKSGKVQSIRRYSVNDRVYYFCGDNNNEEGRDYNSTFWRSIHVQVAPGVLK